VKNVNVAMCASGASWVVLYGKKSAVKGKTPSVNHHYIKYSPRATEKKTKNGGEKTRTLGPFRAVTGALNQISCGFRDQVWGLSNHHVYFLTNVDAANPTGAEKFFKVTDAPLKHKWISVGLTKNNVWSVSLDGNVYKRSGFSSEKPMGTAWDHIPGTNLK